jgi:multicomponent Na+:H+ antiporter subunit E
MLGAALAVLWVTLSGRIHDQLTLTLGGVSIVLVIFLVHRMRLLDLETASFFRIPRLAAYWAWLGGEIVKANIAVARAVLKVDLDISPQLFRVYAPQRTDMGKTIFANSITLTPGTVTVDVDGDELVVHALLESMAEPSGFQDMGARATHATEGGAS